jgi:hypothetical protein
MSHPKYSRPELEALEGRDTPAVTPVLSNGVLFLVGGPRAAQATVSARADQIVVTQASGRESTFAAAGVRGVIFLGFGGRDTFANQTAVNAVAFGGPGRDDLRAGSGRDTLLGGPGRDALAGDGNDRLRANLGLDARTLAGGQAGMSRRLTTDPVLVQGLASLQGAGVGITAANGSVALVNSAATINILSGTIRRAGGQPGRFVPGRERERAAAAADHRPRRVLTRAIWPGGRRRPWRGGRRPRAARTF